MLCRRLRELHQVPLRQPTLFAGVQEPVALDSLERAVGPADGGEREKRLERQLCVHGAG